MRCGWAERSAVEREYHDSEWGVPVHDGNVLFERFSLQGAQAGLSLRTVLAKREHYQRVFHGFDIAQVAAMSDEALFAATRDTGIIRHRLKVASVRGNAIVCMNSLGGPDGFSALLWSVVNGESVRPVWRTPEDVPIRTPTSDRMSALLRAHGFRFAGSAICQGFMASTGMVQAHLIDCPWRR